MDTPVTRKIVAIFTGLVALFFGHDPAVLKIVYALMVMQVFDFVTAIMGLAYTKQKFDYRVFGNGIIKKLSMLVAVSFGYFIDIYKILGTVNVSIELAVATAFISVEVLSILGNFKEMGITIPGIDKYIKLD